MYVHFPFNSPTHAQQPTYIYVHVVECFPSRVYFLGWCVVLSQTCTVNIFLIQNQPPTRMMVYCCCYLDEEWVGRNLDVN